MISPIWYFFACAFVLLSGDEFCPLLEEVELVVIGSFSAFIGLLSWTLSYSSTISHEQRLASKIITVHIDKKT